MARVSIVTPVYNGAKYIDECIANVARQNVEGLEHVVVDGGSSDGTVERLEALKAQWPHLRFVSEPDKGQSDAMNKGVRLARAGIIGFLNVDDFYTPTAVGDAVSYLEKAPAIDMVVGDCWILGEGDVLEWVNKPSDLRIESLVLGWDYNHFPVNPSAYFYRRRVHDIIGEYDSSEYYAMDVAFIFACAEKVKISYLPRHWGHFRYIAGTKTYDDEGLGRDRVNAICEDYKSRFTSLQRGKMGLIKSGYDLKRLKQSVARQIRRATKDTRGSDRTP